jgi:hypothetical protein
VSAARAGIVAALMTIAGGAAGAEPPLDEARLADAERLFEQGKTLLAKDDWKGACALFEASATLIEAVPALVKVARCHAHENRRAKAIEVYEHALSLQPWPELDRLVRAELYEMQQKTPSIRVTLLAPAAGVTLRRNGRKLGPDALRAPLWTDVGAEERLEAEAPGYHAAVFDVKAKAEGEVIEVRVSLTRDAPPPAPPRPKPDARRPAGWAFAGAGGLALGLGAAFGVEYLVRRGHLFDDCAATLADGRHVCPGSTADRADAASAARTRAGVLLGIGGALTAAGVVLLATAPKRTEPLKISLSFGPRAVELGGAF